MAEEKEAPKKLSRRQFVKGAAAVAGAGALAGCAPAASPAPECPPAVECAPCPGAGVPETWDEVADVVIVGYGDAGGSAAITAHDAGADVLILEKMPKDKGAGGNSRVGGNMFLTFTDVDGALAYFMAMEKDWGGSVEPETVQAWAEQMIAYPAWLESMGAELAPAGYAEPEFPGLPGAESVRTLRFQKSFDTPPDQNRYGPYDFLSALVEERSIKVMYETPGKSLITNAQGEVIGVVAESQGKLINVKASKAVVLTCGGFDFNKEMKRNYLKGPCYGMGSPARTGDGIIMALKVGADLWHMNNHAGPNPVGFMPPGLETTIRMNPPEFRFIWVDQDGKRFQDESRSALHGRGHEAIYYYDSVPQHIRFPRVPLWIVFDETTRLAGSIARPAYKGFSWNSYFDVYVWSDDNSKEVESGWILQGDTLEELAARIDTDPAMLKETVTKYNEYCVVGKDDDFGRPENRLAPLDSAPYYAIEAWPVMVNTQGGPKRNSKAQIVDPFNEPIGRLYSAGDMGSIYGWTYNGGGNIGECFAFGRIAGEHAAALEPWS
ncbi:MAG TPA: FAD-binding protein [Anaerolineae bacterium]|nr:FAD-binding protein [Anaerolineae bacterium]